MSCVEETSKQTDQMPIFALTLFLSKKTSYSYSIKMCYFQINGFTFKFYLAPEKLKEDMEFLKQC